MKLFSTDVDQNQILRTDHHAICHNSRCRRSLHSEDVDHKSTNYQFAFFTVFKKSSTDSTKQTDGIFHTVCGHHFAYFITTHDVPSVCFVEIVFHRPNVSHNLFPRAMPNVSRVLVAKLLGVHLRHDLNFSQHVESVVATCNQRLYLLAQLKKQGLGISAIDTVFKAIVLNRILYAVPVYFGYLTEGQKHLLQRVLDRACRRGFTPYYHNLEALAERKPSTTFSAIAVAKATASITSTQ